MFSPFAAAPASAEVLVSTVGQTAAAGGGRVWANRWHAQGFTTGSNAAGYTLTSIEARTNQPEDAPNELRAQLWSDVTGNPGVKLADLTVPATITASGATPANIVFAAPAGTRLAANTTYYFVIGGAASRSPATNKQFQILNTASDSEDSGAAAGWSVDDTSRFGSGNNGNPPSGWSSFDQTRMFRVNGSARGAALSTNANLSALAATNATSATGTYSALSIGTFAKATLAYTASVANSITHVKLTPTVEATGKATVKVGKGTSLTAVGSGSESSAIALSVGANALKVEVTAEDGTTKKTYTVTVTRASSTTTTPQVSFASTTYSVNEGASVTLTVNISPVLATASRVAVLATTPTSAENPDDYTWSGLTGSAGSRVLALPANASTATFTFTAVADSKNEGAETATWYLQQFAGEPYTVVRASERTTVTIADTSRSTSTTGSALVSNIGQTTFTPTVTIGTVPVAQKFTTGSTTAGYTLESLEIEFAVAVGTPANLRAELWSATSGGAPDQKLAGLTVPSTVGVGAVAFDAPSNTSLDASTSYFMVVYRSGTTTGSLRTTRTNNEDTGSASGWSIGDTRHGRSGTSWGTNTIELKIRVNGAVKTGTTPPAATPTVSLSVDRGNVVAEGSAATIVATLSEALGSDVTIPVTVTRGSAEAGDIGTLTGITVSQGFTQGGANITTAQDTDADHETFTVSLGTPLPSGVSAGTPNSVTVTIQDDEAAKHSLVGLSLTVGGSAVVLSPAFATSTTRYTGTVAPTATSASVTPTWIEGHLIETVVSSATPDFDSILTQQGSALASSGTSKTVTLAASGDTWVSVQISDNNAGESTGYRVVLKKSTQSSNANLSALTAKSSTDGSTFTALTLSPSTFSAATTAYTASVASSVTHVKLTPTKAHTGASIKVGKGTSLTAVNSGADSAAIALSEGANAIKVEVTAQDGTTKVAYTVTVTRAASTPTVSLSAAPNPVAEGSSVTVTATLSEALGSNISIPVTVTVDTAEPGDIGTLTSIAIAGGSTTGTGTITTAQDDDTDHETFTVSLGTLPSGVSAGSPSSLAVRIADDEAPGRTATDAGLSGGLALSVAPGDGSLALTWNKPWGPNTAYEVNWKASSAPDADATAPGDPSTGWVAPRVLLNGTTWETKYLFREEYTIGGLVNGTAYDVRVRQFSGGETGRWATGAGTPAAPAPPASLTLSVDPVALAHGGAVTVTARLDAPAMKPMDVWFDTAGDGGAARWGPDCAWGAGHG